MLIIYSILHYDLALEAKLNPLAASLIKVILKSNSASLTEVLVFIHLYFIAIISCLSY